MILIRAEQCTGCGVCLDACATGAIFLAEGKAAVDGALCRQCEACVAACPSGAIFFSANEVAAADAASLPVLRPEPEVIRVNAQHVPVRSSFLPALSAALSWAGREVLPWLADLLADRGTTRAPGSGTAHSHQTLVSGAKGSGRQHRQRRRGGSS